MVAACVPEESRRVSTSSTQGDLQMAFEVRDRLDRPWPFEAIPRKPVLSLTLDEPPFKTESVGYLIAGLGDAELLGDFSDEPLRKSTLERVVPCSAAVSAATLIFEPLSALIANQTYTFILSGWTRSARGRLLFSNKQPWTQVLRVSGAENAGAQLLDSWPADGAYHVPPNLSVLAVHFDGELSADLPVQLEHATGELVDITAEQVPCTHIGWPTGFCVALHPTSELVASSTYRIRVSEDFLDSTGAPIGPWTATFQTAPARDESPPQLLPLPCYKDETGQFGACLSVTDMSINVRAQANESVRAFWRTELGDTCSVANRGELRFEQSGFAAQTLVRTTLELYDAANNQAVYVLELRTSEPLATVTITEVQLDPAGPEPYQEYVELFNFGTSQVNLEGFRLADSPDAEGDTFDSPFLLPPQTRILVVADRFDPLHRADIPVPPGVFLIRIGTSLASGGLSNSGESLFLRDAQARRISSTPSLPSLGQGVCWVRATSDPRTGAINSFVADALKGCTPGLADRIPVE